MIFVIAFSILVLLCVFFISIFGKEWNLTPFLSISSGGLLSLSFLDFLPHSFSEGVEWIGGLILLGVLIQILFEMYIVKYLGFLDFFVSKDKSPTHPHAHVISSLTTCSITGCLVVCAFFDGIRLFAGLSITSSLGFLTGVGLFFHLLSEGIVITFLGLKSGIKKQATFMLSFCVVSAFVLGAFLAQSTSYLFKEVYMQAFATGVLIYVCFFHLLPLAFLKENRKWFVLGLILFSLPHLTHLY